MKVFALAGSLRTGSFNKKLLDLVVPLLEAQSLEVDVFDFKAAQVPMFDPDVHEKTPAPVVKDAQERLRACQGLVVVSPEYNHGIPGALKNFIDALSRPMKTQPMKGKLVAQLGVSTSRFGTGHCQHALRETFSTVGAMSFPGEFVVAEAKDAFDDAGQLKIEAMQKELVDYVHRYARMLEKVAAP